MSPDHGFNHVWLSDGNANFKDSGQLFDTQTSISIASGDIDQDGHTDVLVRNKRVTQYGETTAREYSASSCICADSIHSMVRLADLDGDGDLDIFVARIGPNGVLLNDSIQH